MTEYPSLQNMHPATRQPTLCELDAKFSDVLPRALEHLLEQYPDLNIQPDSIRPSYSRDTIKSAFLPVNDSIGLALVSTWRESGVAGVLTRIQENSPSSLAKLSGILLSLWRFPYTINTFFYPHLRLSQQEMLEKFSTTRDWSDAPLKCIAWHPHTRKLAVVSRDDCVRISGNGATTKPILRHTGQRGISCLTWRPCGTAELAVGCRMGIMLWTLDPASVVSRPSTSCVRSLSKPGHSPVTSLAWNSSGRLLASASPADSNMLIWSVASEQCLPVKRVSGGGVSLLRWSLDGSKLFAATPGTTFRVWETKTWLPERWSVPGAQDTVKCAAWSPDNRFLVFATEKEPLLYAVSFVSSSDSAVPVVDLCEVIVDEELELLGGGLVQNIVWDSEGLRLAISYRNTSLISIFSTRTGSTLAITPCGWIRGAKDEFPSCMQFQADNKSSGGSILTIGWSSGRLQYCPLSYSPYGISDAKLDLYTQPQLFSNNSF